MRGSVTSQQDGCSFVSNLGLTVRSLAPDVRQLMHCVKHRRRVWTPILTPAVFIKQSPTFLSHLQVKLSKSTNTPKNRHFQLFNVSFCIIQQLQVTSRWVSELVMDWHKLIKRAMNHRQGTHCQSPISLWKFERLCAVRCGSVCLRATTETL